MSDLEVTSTGTPGDTPEERGDRSYQTLGKVVNTREEIVAACERVMDHCETHNSRRGVFKACVGENVVQYLRSIQPLNTEVVADLSVVDSSYPWLTLLAWNCHETPSPELDEVARYWEHQNEEGMTKTPLERVGAVVNRGYSLTDCPKLHDAEALAKIWRPFGWTNDGVMSFINGFVDNDRVTFSGVRDTYGNLVSVTIGERVDFGGVTFYEASEFGTLPHPDLRGHGLCTAALVGLHAQILEKHATDPSAPVIYAEFSTAARSDIVGAHTGMIIPEDDRQTPGPRQILYSNVPVEDGLPPSNVHPNNPYLRNFVFGLLPRESIDNFYAPKQRQQIRQYIRR